MKSGCKKCLLPANYLNIEIDENGICQYCRNFKRPDYLGTEKLLEDIKVPLSKNTSDKYDCIVGFSGGRDSTYLLWYVVKKLKLRPLAVFADDLFIPKATLENIKTTCEILGVDLKHIKHNHLKKCVGHHLKAWIKRPVPETLVFINIGERLGYENVSEIEAAKQGVKLIFGGRTPGQLVQQYKSALILHDKGRNRQDGNTDLDEVMDGYKKERNSLLKGFMKQVILNPFLIMSYNGLKTQFKEFRLLEEKDRLISENNLTTIHPFFDYVHWKEDELEEVLFNDLKWKLPEGKKTTARVGCEVDTIRQYLYLKTLGYNDSHVDLSYLIRDDQITREEGKAKLDESIQFEETEIIRILEKAGVNGTRFIKKINRKYDTIH